MERSGDDAATRPDGAIRPDDADRATWSLIGRQLFVHSPIGMGLLDLDGRFVEVNAAMSAFLHRSATELRGMPLAEVTHPEDVAGGALQQRMSVGEREAYRTSKRYLLADGTVVWGDLSVCAVCDEYGHPRRFVVQVADVTAERATQAELELRSSSDPLTGLANRETVLALLGHALRLPSSMGTLGVLYVDVDGFKAVNDAMGHAGGDEVLTVLAARMVEVVGGSGVVGRMGGDEFVVVLDEAESTDEVEAVADLLRRALSAVVVVDGVVQHPTVSIGVAFPGRGLHDAAQLVQAADEAMYRAKRAGRNRWERYERPAPDDASDGDRLSSALGRSASDGVISAWFQPVVELGDGRVVGHEALARWHHPRRGLLRPAQFMPAAEGRGLTAGIDDAILDQACRRLATGPDPHTFVAVNLSLAFAARPDVRDRVRRPLERHDVDPARLVVELTEAVALELPRSSQRELEALDGDGVRLFVDDFGSGYGALSVFDELPVRGVKLDRSLVEGAAGDERRARLLVGLRHLVDALGLVGVIEGIETDEERERLRAMGWRVGQGYLFGPPAPAGAA